MYRPILKLFLFVLLLICNANQMLNADNKTKTYSNPVTAISLPDPTVILADDGRYYLYATEDTPHLPIYSSIDLVNWTKVGTAFTDQSRPGFLEGGNLWAPDINIIRGKYVLYYSLSKWGEEWDNGIGVATADCPMGPFVDKGALFTSRDIGVKNSIDQFYIEDKGVKFLFWGSFSGLYATELSDDGLSLNRDAKITQVAGTAFEGVYIYKKGEYYYMFASIGTCCEGINSTYTLVVGRSKSLLGEYVTKSNERLLDDKYEVVIKRNDRFYGPGHNAEIITDKNGDDWILYHAIDKNSPQGRKVLLDKINWINGWPVVNDGTPSLTSEMPKL